MIESRTVLAKYTSSKCQHSKFNMTSLILLMSTLQSIASYRISTGSNLGESVHASEPSTDVPAINRRTKRETLDDIESNVDVFFVYQTTPRQWRTLSCPRCPTCPRPEPTEADIVDGRDATSMTLMTTASTEMTTEIMTTTLSSATAEIMIYPISTVDDNLSDEEVLNNLKTGNDGKISFEEDTGSLME
ncbi:hypothetical protein HDE_13126 [Halotydeus destructor]|nr:hypothetical protein HDE_13126 [Halotydeus destructor]